jgi:CheY-like chemotaxis protein
MARLQGELDLIGIDTLFQALASRSVEGYLEVRRGEQRVVLALSSSGIRLVSGARRIKPLGEILVRAGKLTKEQLDAMLADQQSSSTPLGELVVQRGILPKSVIDSALRKQVAEEISDLFSWTGASFEFHLMSEASPPPDDWPRSAIVLDGNVVSLMLEAARQTDELQQIRALIADDRLIPILTELPGVLEDSGLDLPAVEEIVPLVDGERSVEDILEASLHPKFTVLRTLFGLVMCQVLKIRDRGRRDGPATVLIRKRSGETDFRRKRVVLVLSSSSSFSGGIAFLLRHSGYTVIEDGLSREPAELLASHPETQAVVADVALDAAEGRDYCRKLKEATSVPLIVITGNVGPSLARHSLESGARFVLPKPLDEARLLERLAELLISG